MNDFIKQLMTISIVMTMISGVFLLIRHILKDRFAPRWRYYAWIFLLFGFFILFRPHFSTEVLYTAPASVAYSYSTGVSISRILFFLWLLGVIIFLSVRLSQHLSFCRQVERLWEPVQNSRYIECLQTVCRQMGIDRNIELKCVPELASPLLYGLIHPTILVPAVMYSEEALTLVLRHELIHYQRQDLWYKLFVEAVHGIHWFNPFLIMIKKEIDKDLEASCDQRVIYYSTQEEKLLYCQMILDTVKNQAGINTVISTGFGKSAAAIKQRFNEILSSRPKRSFLGVILMVLGLIIVSGQFLDLSFAMPGGQYDPEMSGYPQTMETTVEIYEYETASTQIAETMMNDSIIDDSMLDESWMDD